MHKAAVAEGFEVGIADAVVGLVVLAGGEEAEVVLEVMVDFLEAIGAGDHGEEPARPGEGLNVVPFEELAVEIADKALHRGISRDVLLGAPTQEETRLAANLVLHLALGGFGNVDFVAKTLEAKVFEWLVGAIDLLLFGIHFEAILLKEGRKRADMLHQGRLIGRKEDDIVGITCINHAIFGKMLVNLLQINVGKERRNGRTCHHAVFFAENFPFEDGTFFGENLFEKAVKGWVFGQ